MGGAAPFLRRVVTAVWASAALCSLPASSSGTPLAYIATADGSLVLVDTATDDVSAIIPLGVGFGNPLVVHPDGSKLYLLTSDPSVLIVDTCSHEVIGEIDVASAVSVAISKGGEWLYVVESQERGKVAVIDTVTLETAEEFEVAGFPSDIAVGPEGRFLYITNTFLDRERRPCVINLGLFCDIPLSILDLSLGTRADIAIGDELGPVAVSHDGANIYVGNISLVEVTPEHYDARGVLSVISTAGYQIRRVVLSRATPSSIAVAPDDERVLVTHDDLSIIDPRTGEIVDELLVGERPGAVAIGPAGSRAYVSGASGSVSVIDLATRSVVDTLPFRAVAIAIGPEPPQTPTATTSGDVTATPGPPTSSPTSSPTSTPPTPTFSGSRTPTATVTVTPTGTTTPTRSATPPAAATGTTVPSGVPSSPTSTPPILTPTVTETQPSPSPTATTGMSDGGSNGCAVVQGSASAPVFLGAGWLLLLVLTCCVRRRPPR